LSRNWGACRTVVGENGVQFLLPRSRARYDPDRQANSRTSENFLPVSCLDHGSAPRGMVHGAQSLTNGAVSELRGTLRSCITPLTTVWYRSRPVIRRRTDARSTTDTPGRRRSMSTIRGRRVGRRAPPCNGYSSPPAIIRDGRMDLQATNHLGRAMHESVYDSQPGDTPTSPATHF
jgi:hypothetical protein